MPTAPQPGFEIPVLETERLRLRPHRISDFANSCALWSSPEVNQHTTHRALTPEEVWSRLLRYAGHWSLLRYGYWVAEEKSSGQFIGEVGFADYKREIDPPLSAPEGGWVLMPYAHGKGYATESITAILRWGDAHLDSDRTVCIISPENVASIRVAEKCGYRRLNTVQYKEYPVVLFQRMRP